LGIATLTPVHTHVWLHPLQSNQESSDDRQREFAERLQQYQSQVAAAQQSAEAAQARLDAHAAAQRQALEQKQAKEDEMRNAQQRCVPGLMSRSLWDRRMFLAADGVSMHSCVTGAYFRA
jgi:chromosome segregation ATPase